MLSFNKKNILDCVIYLPILWAFTGMFLYPNGRKLMVVFVVLAAISSIFSYGFKAAVANIKTNKLLWLLGAYSIFAIFAKTYYGYSSSLLRGLLSLFIFLAILPPSLLSKVNLKHLVIIGTVTSFTFVMVQTFSLGHTRMQWGINPIPYATFSASLAILAFYYLLQSNNIKRVMIWIITFSAALVPLLHSQSRGLWLALAIALVIALLKAFLSQKKSLYLLIPILIIGGIAFHFSSDKITQRIAQTKAEVKQLTKGNLNTSAGLRVQMWQAAIILAKESPIIGLGDQHIEYKKQLVKQKFITKQVVPFTHYHNQFLSDLVKHGIIGLSLLLLSILLPVYFLKQNNNEYTWPCLLIVTVFVTASLTDVPFQHAQTLTLYFIIIFLCIYKQSNFKEIKSSL